MIHSYGVTNRYHATDSIDLSCEELLINGYTTIDSGISGPQLIELKIELEEIYSKQIQEIGNEDDLKKINDRDIVRCVLSYSRNFLKISLNPHLLEFCKRILGPEFLLLMQNGILNRHDRENFQARWHRDLNYQHWTSSKPLAINALLCLDEFTLNNGGTFILPSTHHVEYFPSDKYVEKFEKQLSVPAGTFLVLDAMVWHRAGQNISTSNRYAVNHVIGMPFMAQQVNIPNALARNGFSMPSEIKEQKYLGYKWSPASDAIEWRYKRLM